MEKDIAEGKLGDVGSYDLEFKEGKLKFVLKAAVADSGVSAGVTLELEADKFLDKLAALIPGPIDNAVFGVLKAALKV